MGVAQRTYSFRAPADFGERLLAAQDALPAMLADEDRARDFHHELGIALARRRGALGPEPDGSEMAHFVLDALIATTERALDDSALWEASPSADEPEGEEWRRASTRLLLGRDD